MSEDNRTIVDFANEYPDYLWLCEYISSLAKYTPDIFMEPADENKQDTLATMLSTQNFGGAYMFGGAAFMFMMKAEYEERGRYEECAEIQRTLEFLGPSTEPSHDAIRQKQTNGGMTGQH